MRPLDEGPRYPGSLVISYAKSRAQDWAEKYRSNKPPGKLQQVKAWLVPKLLRFEGLILGGAVMWALASFGAEVYMHERVEDLLRRHERRQHYEASCLSWAADLAGLQHSEAFWSYHAANAALRLEVRKARLQQHEQQLAAVQVAAARWRRWCEACGKCDDRSVSRMSSSGGSVSDSSGENSSSSSSSSSGGASSSIDCSSRNSDNRGGSSNKVSPVAIEHEPGSSTQSAAADTEAAAAVAAHPPPPQQPGGQRYSLRCMVCGWQLRRVERWLEAAVEAQAAAAESVEHWANVHKCASGMAERMRGAVEQRKQGLMHYAQRLAAWQKLPSHKVIFTGGFGGNHDEARTSSGYTLHALVTLRSPVWVPDEMEQEEERAALWLEALAGLVEGQQGRQEHMQDERGREQLQEQGQQQEEERAALRVGGLAGLVGKGRQQRIQEELEPRQQQGQGQGQQHGGQEHIQERQRQQQKQGQQQAEERAVLLVEGVEGLEGLVEGKGGQQQGRQEHMQREQQEEERQQQQLKLRVGDPGQYQEQHQHQQEEQQQQRSTGPAYVHAACST